MEALFLQILQWVRENPGGAYGAVFLAALGESLVRDRTGADARRLAAAPGSRDG